LFWASKRLGLQKKLVIRHNFMYVRWQNQLNHFIID